MTKLEALKQAYFTYCEREYEGDEPDWLDDKGWLAIAYTESEKGEQWQLYYDVVAQQLLYCVNTEIKKEERYPIDIAIYDLLNSSFDDFIRDFYTLENEEAYAEYEKQLQNKLLENLKAGKVAEIKKIHDRDSAHFLTYSICYNSDKAVEICLIDNKWFVEATESEED